MKRSQDDFSALYCWRLARFSVFLFLFGLASLFSACSTLNGSVQGIHSYILTAEQVEEVRMKINAHPCAEGYRAVVIGSQFVPDGGMRLTVGCRR